MTQIHCFVNPFEKAPPNQPSEKLRSEEAKKKKKTGKIENVFSLCYTIILS
jgi:hypothetical protein